MVFCYDVLHYKNSGQNQKIELYLYKDNEKEPYFKEPLYLYLAVIEK